MGAISLCGVARMYGIRLDGTRRMRRMGGRVWRMRGIGGIAGRRRQEAKI